MADAEGAVLEGALKRARLRQRESAWGLRRGEDGGWQVVELPAAAEVVNPVAKEVVKGLEEKEIKVEWVQRTLWKEAEEQGMCVDLVLSVVNGGVGQWGRRDYWWIEVKWTRGDHEDRGLEVVEEAWRNVEEFRKVIGGVEDWRLKLGGRRVYKPQNFGILVLSRKGWRLELLSGLEFRVTFGGGGGDGGGGSGSGEERGGGDEAAVSGGGISGEGQGGGCDGGVGGGGDDGGGAGGRGGDDGAGSDENSGGGDGEQMRRRKRRYRGDETQVRKKVRRAAECRECRSGGGYDAVVRWRWKRGGAEGSEVARNTRSHGADLTKGVTQVVLSRV